jgi:hypothetical protein
MPERPMSHVIFGRPQFRRSNSSTFGLVQLLHKSLFIEMALLQKVEDDGLKRLSFNLIHGAFLSDNLPTIGLRRASRQFLRNVSLS